MVVRCARATAVIPETEPSILLVAFHFAIRSDDFMSLIDRPFKILRRDPVVVEIDTHAVLEFDAHLHSVVGIDAVAHEAFLLSNRRERNWFAFVIAVNQIGPVWPDIAEWI